MMFSKSRTRKTVGMHMHSTTFPEWSSCTNHPQHPNAMLHPLLTWLEGFPSCLYSWLAITPQWYRTNTPTGRMLHSNMVQQADVDGRRRSNRYEVNLWMGLYGRGKPLLGGPMIRETAVRKIADHQESMKRGQETCRHHKAKQTWFEFWTKVCSW